MSQSERYPCTQYVAWAVAEVLSILFSSHQSKKSDILLTTSLWGLEPASVNWKRPKARSYG